jgi:hypothetical protein
MVHGVRLGSLTTSVPGQCDIHAGVTRWQMFTHVLSAVFFSRCMSE